MLTYTINGKTRGINGFGVSPPDYVMNVKFDGTNAATFTVPGDLPMGAMGAMGKLNPIGNVKQAPQGRNKYILIFKYGIAVPGDVWVRVGGTATPPTTNALVKNQSELFPDGYEVFAGDVVSAQCLTANQTMSIAVFNIKD